MHMRTYHELDLEAAVPLYALSIYKAAVFCKLASILVYSLAKM